MLQTEQLKQQTFIFSQFWDQGAGMAGFWWALSSWFADGHHLDVVSPRCVYEEVEKEKPLVSLLTETQTVSDQSSILMTSLNQNHLFKAPDLMQSHGGGWSYNIWIGEGRRYNSVHPSMQHRVADITENHPEVKSEVAQSCPTLCDPMDCSLPGSSVHGVFQIGILEWVAISFSKESSPPKDQTGSPALQADSLPSESPGNPLYHG